VGHELPVGWRLARLGDVASESSERNLVLRLGRDDIQTVDNQRGLIPSNRLLGEDFSRYKTVAHNAFAYNPMRLNVGSIGLWAQNRPVIVSPDYVVFSCDETALFPPFLDFLRRTSVWGGQISQSGQGSVRLRYYFHHIADFRLPLPPLREQRAIATVLRTVQRAKEACEQVIAATRALKQSLLHYLITWGAIPFDQPERVQLKESEIGQVPQHWQVLQLRDVADLSTGTTPATSVAEYYDGKTPFIKTAQIANNRIRTASAFVSLLAIEKYRLKLYEPGTILLAMYGQGKTRGQCSLLEISAAITQNAAAIRPRATVHPAFLWTYLLSRYEFLRSEGIQGHISHLNLGYVGILPVPVPPESEQTVIASHLSAVDAKLDVEEARRSALDRLSESLLHNLMTGKVRVDHLVGQLDPEATS
jgi:type I restriction enzyme, S subunit